MNTYKDLFSVVLFVVLFLTGTLLMLYLQTSLHGTTMILGVDMYPRWIGTQAVLNGDSPYSLSTRQQIWLEIYGSTNMPDGNLFGFYYPPAITTLLMPFVMLGLSANMASILWCAFLFASLSTALIMWILNYRNLPTGLILFPTLLVSGWLFRPAFSNYLLGQFALFSVLTASAAWFCFEQDKPIMAGIFSTLSLIKPSLTIIPIGFLVIKNRRSLKGISTLFASSLLLYLPPTLLIGWWLPDFLADISNYALENRIAWSIKDVLSIPGILWILTGIVLVGQGLHTKNSLLTFSAAFALNVAITPHSADYDLVAFMPLLALVGNHWFTIEKKRGLLIIFYFILIWFPWFSLLLIIQNVDTNSVETWYRFIWQIYPTIILLANLFTHLSNMKNDSNNLPVRLYE